MKFARSIVFVVPGVDAAMTIIVCVEVGSEMIIWFEELE